MDESAHRVTAYQPQKPQYQEDHKDRPNHGNLLSSYDIMPLRALLEPDGISFPFSSRSPCPVQDIFYELHSRRVRHSVKTQFRLLAQEIHESEEPPLIVCADMALKIFLCLPF